MLCGVCLRTCTRCKKTWKKALAIPVFLTMTTWRQRHCVPIRGAETPNSQTRLLETARATSLKACRNAQDSMQLVLRTPYAHLPISANSSLTQRAGNFIKPNFNSPNILACSVRQCVSNHCGLLRMLLASSKHKCMEHNSGAPL